MTQPDIQDEPTAGQREYALAKAYTEARARFGARAFQVKFFAFLVLFLMPFGYAALMPAVSDDLNAGWFRAWGEATAGLGRLLADLLPGLAAGSQSIYGGDPQRMAIFLHFAGLDLACVFGAILLLFGFSATLPWVPRHGGPQHGFLREIAKGFPSPYVFSSRRLGGAAGGLGFALCLVLIAFGTVYAFFIDPVMSDGSFFRDAHYYCVESRRAGRVSRCIEYSEYDLAETVWKLGWMSSLAGLLVPGLLWVGIVSLQYPFWLIAGRPWRS
jgi:hypothetical protein